MEAVVQWYAAYPERLEKEDSLVKGSFPGFSFFTNEEGNACWKGLVDVRDEFGNLCPANCEYNPLEIIVECPPDYPHSIPRVYDVNGILRKHSCKHLHPDSNKICYGIRGRESSMNFHEYATIRDLIRQIAIFIYQQYKAEQNGNVWETDRLHGEYGLLQSELEQGEFVSSNLCPCGNGASYQECCMPKVEKLIKIICKHENIPITLLGRNDKCGCYSGKKYKKCCKERCYFIHHLRDNVSLTKLNQVLESCSEQV